MADNCLVWRLNSPELLHKPLCLAVHNVQSGQHVYPVVYDKISQYKGVYSVYEWALLVRSIRTLTDGRFRAHRADIYGA